MQPVDAADLVNLHDVRVDQRGGGLGLQLESLEIGSIVGQFRPEDFHGDPPLQPLLFGQIDFGHGPASQPAEQVKVAQLPRRKIAVGRRRR